MEVEEAAGGEPSTEGIKLFTLADKAEAFIRPACLSPAPLPNSTRRQLVERFGKPSLPCTHGQRGSLAVAQCREKFGPRPIFKIFSLDQIRVDQENKAIFLGLRVFGRARKF